MVKKSVLNADWDGLDYADIVTEDGQRYRRKNIGKNKSGFMDHKFYKVDADGKEIEVASESLGLGSSK
jgi:hypothetical protein